MLMRIPQATPRSVSARPGTRRTAAYKSKELTWNQLLKSNQQWKTDVDVQKLT